MLWLLRMKQSPPHCIPSDPISPQKNWWPYIALWELLLIHVLNNFSSLLSLKLHRITQFLCKAQAANEHSAIPFFFFFHKRPYKTTCLYVKVPASESREWETWSNHFVIVTQCHLVVLLCTGFQLCSSLRTSEEKRDDIFRFGFVERWQQRRHCMSSRSICFFLFCAWAWSLF